MALPSTPRAKRSRKREPNRPGRQDQEPQDSRSAAAPRPRRCRLHGAGEWSVFGQRSVKGVTVSLSVPSINFQNFKKKITEPPDQ